MPRFGHKVIYDSQVNLLGIGKLACLIGISKALVLDYQPTLSHCAREMLVQAEYFFGCSTLVRHVAMHTHRGTATGKNKSWLSALISCTFEMLALKHQIGI